MARQNIYTTLGCASVANSNQLFSLYNFLYQNRNLFMSDDSVRDAFRTRTTGSSLIGTMVNRMSQMGRLTSNYSILTIPTGTASIPEIATMSFIPFDIMQMADVVPIITKTMSLVPQLNNRLVINATEMTYASGAFSDLTRLQHIAVRDFLSRSFFVSRRREWLTPGVVIYIAKVYNMAIGRRIAQLFGLSDQVRDVISTLFALFFVGKMTSTEAAPGVVKSNYRDLLLPQPNDLLQTFGLVEDTIGKAAPETLEDVFACIDALSLPTVMSSTGSRLNRAVFNMRFRSLHPEGHVSVIALEYPPYFFYLILLALSGVGIGLSITMKQLNLVNSGKQLAESLSTSSLFYSSIEG